MIKVIDSDFEKVEKNSNGGVITTLTYNLVNVKKLEHPAEAETPRHSYDVNTLHVIVKG